MSGELLGKGQSSTDDPLEDILQLERLSGDCLVRNVVAMQCKTLRNNSYT